MRPQSLSESAKSVSPRNKLPKGRNLEEMDQCFADTTNAHLSSGTCPFLKQRLRAGRTMDDDTNSLQDIYHWNDQNVDEEFVKTESQNLIFNISSRQERSYSRRGAHIQEGKASKASEGRASK